MLTEKPWKPQLVVRLLVALFAGFLLGAMVVQGYQSQFGNEGANRLLIFILGVLSFHGVGLVLVHVFVRQHGMTWREAFGFNEPRLGRALFLGLLVGVMVIPIALSLRELSARIIILLAHFAWVERLIGNSAQPQEVVRIVQDAATNSEFLTFGFVTIFVAPFVEEVIFRGVLYPAVKQSGYPKLAFWGISIFFGVWHWNLPALLPLTFVGVVLTLLYETTRNLLTPITTHALFNAANFAYMIWQKAHPAV